MSLVNDMLSAVRAYLDGYPVGMEKLANKLPLAAADKKYGWLFSAPEGYKHAWRALFDITPNELASISGLRRLGDVGCVAQRTAMPMPDRQLQSWSVNGDLFRVSSKTKEPLYPIYEDITTHSAGDVGAYQVVVRAPIAGNSFFLNPDQIYCRVPSARCYSYQQEVISVGSVRGCVICWARTRKFMDPCYGEALWMTMRRAIVALDRLTGS